MQRILCKSKIHRAIVTGANLEYEGSISVDSRLLEAADIREYEQVHVLNLNTGARFETYAIVAEPGSGEIVLNGAAARLAQPGDRVIIMSYALYDEAELDEHRPRKVFVDDRNRIPVAHRLGGTPV
jgi:aspartate 1-decarboxylase